MRILALDTATEGCSAAVLVDGDVHERFEVAPRGHASLILPWIDDLMAGAGLTAGRLDAIAVSSGPGSFTGIRIGFSVAQGIGMGSGVGLVVVSTLAALALEGRRAAATPPRRVLAVLDARMGEVYAAGYDYSACELGEVAVPERVCAPETLVAEAGCDWLGVGPGFRAYDALSSMAGALPELLPRARGVAVLAADKLKRGDQPVAPDRAEPIYLRDRVTG